MGNKNEHLLPNLISNSFLAKEQVENNDRNRTTKIMNILEFLRPQEISINEYSSVIVYNGEKISYNELFNSVIKTAAYLNEQRIKQNDIVPLLYENSSEFIVLVLSLWQLGAVPVPLNSKLLSKDLNEQINFINPSIVLKSGEFKNLSTEVKSLTIPFNELKDQGDLINPDFDTDKIALILFTSGSSGKPKAVMLTLNNLIQSAVIGNNVLNQTSEDRWLASLPFYHIGGFSIIFRTLFYGASIIIPESLSNKHLAESIINYKPTLASFVSNQLKYLVDEKLIPPEELRTVLLGGGFSDKDLILNAIEKGWNIAKVYGSTETSSFVTFMNSEEVKKKLEASGKVIQPNEIIISEEGEIAVKSPAVMKGYFNNDEETIAKLKNDFYHTGDTGFLDDEGYLFVKAKKNDLIVTGGENVNPVEVENAILSNSKIKDVCVVGVQDEKWGQIVSAAVVLKDNINLSQDELKNYLKKKLASFKIPKRIIFVKDLPKSGLGKIKRLDVKSFFYSNLK